MDVRFVPYINETKKLTQGACLAIEDAVRLGKLFHTYAPNQRTKNDHTTLRSAAHASEVQTRDAIKTVEGLQRGIREYSRFKYARFFCGCLMARLGLLCGKFLTFNFSLWWLPCDVWNFDFHCLSLAEREASTVAFIIWFAGSTCSCEPDAIVRPGFVLCQVSVAANAAGADCARLRQLLSEQFVAGQSFLKDFSHEVRFKINKTKSIA